MVALAETLDAAAKRAAALSDAETCLFVMLVPGGISACATRRTGRHSVTVPWDKIDTAVAAVNEVRRAVLAR